MLRRCAPRVYAARKMAMAAQIAALPEVRQLARFVDVIGNPNGFEKYLSEKHLDFRDCLSQHPDVFTKEAALMVADAAMLTFALHVESRIASMLGEGFYTIGPCGEELMGVMGLVMRETDPMALHYRHAAANICRQLRAGQSFEEVALSRARGYCVSSKDPVTAGAHCALGGHSHDFIVTSTLASQTCPALGRAMGGVLANHLGVPSPFPADLVSFVSLGDGSIHNGHFLSGNNLAEFAVYRGNKAPLLTCITDNGIAISFRTHNYLVRQFSKKLQMPVFVARGDDFADMWLKGKLAADSCRTRARPAALIISNIVRRFGHAATDRQAAYLDNKEIQRQYDTDVVLPMCAQLVLAGVVTQEGLLERCERIIRACSAGFETAHKEQKLTSRAELVARNSAALVPMPNGYTAAPPAAAPLSQSPHVCEGRYGSTGSKVQVMRKHMNKVIDELLEANPNMVYIGEDVRHGGYYLVTDGIAKKYPSRCLDFPPDETALVGAGMGFSQAGLVPIVEIPYAKYLDCAMDIFTEACVMHWLSNGKQPNGMIIRLQGFGKGVFGGNYHTHNTLYMPPGLDVVCYSNGADYQRGMRFALEQAKKGRLTMFVDATELLNLRDVLPGISWEFPYTPTTEFIDFDCVSLHRRPCEGAASAAVPDEERVLIVTYGNGVLTSLQAQIDLEAAGITADVLDCPLLSAPPQGLKDTVGRYGTVLFADVCKEGQHPLATHMTRLLNEGLFRDARRVRCIGAQNTYNPLGTTLTFLSKQDIIASINSIPKA